MRPPDSISESLVAGPPDPVESPEWANLMAEQAPPDAQSVIQIVDDQHHSLLLNMVTTPVEDRAGVGTATFTYADNRLVMVAAKLPARDETLEEGRGVNVELVKVLSEDVRTALTEFAKVHRQAYLDQVPAEEMLERFQAFRRGSRWKAPGEQVDPERRDAWTEIAASPEMRTLVIRGHDLFTAVFGEGEVGTFVRTLQPGTRLVLRATSTTDWPMLVPWGLMYRGDPDAPIDPEEFLGLCFRLEHGRATGKNGLGDPGAATASNILFWGGGGQQDAPALTEAERQRDVFAGWSTPKQVFYPNGADRERLAQVLAFLKKPEPSTISVMYLYGHTEIDHANMPALLLGKEDDQWQSVTDDEVGRTPLEGKPLVFVNACSSAYGSGRYRNRLAAAFRLRKCNAYIGTEAAVPTVLASRVSILFFNLFYRQTVSIPVAAGEALTQVRRFLWEEYMNIGGLFYSYVDKYDVFLADEAELLSRLRLEPAFITVAE